MSQVIKKRIAALRAAMRKADVDACLIPSADPHLSEYLPAHFQARVHFSGFTGSAGTLLVTTEFAGLWTDSRYFEQAQQQLEGTDITLMRQGQTDVPSVDDWLCSNLGKGDVLAASGNGIAAAHAKQLRAALNANKAALRTDIDLPGMVWDKRPALPAAPIYEHPIAYAIHTRAEKLARVRATMQQLGATHHLISTLDDIAYITNLRGADVDYNPVFLAHLLIEHDAATLFVDTRKLDEDVRQLLDDANIQIADYAAVFDALSTLGSDTRILYSPQQVVAAVTSAIPKGVERIHQRNPSTVMKAVKPAAALDHIDAVMRQDGVALVQGFRTIEERLAAGDTVTELDVMDILYEKRAARPDFISESFNTIAAYMENGALPHYSASKEAHSTLHPDGLLLVDSGGQYLGGTTDITRVWAFGDTTREQRDDYTHVLKGMIQLSRAIFPKGASGPQLDALARAPIWAALGDFGHGTGHGVGYFLNVHEGPHSIRPPRANSPDIALEEGMITSIEPGLYKPGRHGIRHENLAVVTAVGTSEMGQFYGFRTLTLCPFDTRAIESHLLDATERDWLNQYHASVEKALLPLLDDAADKAWLKERCRPLD